MMYRFLLLPLIALALVTSCTTYNKQIMTGSGMAIDNAYANPGYDHTKLLNVLLLPVTNSYDRSEVSRHHEELVASLLRNFGKFNYFNVYYDRRHREIAGPVLDIATGRIDRTLLGEVGQEYGAQAVMQVDIEDFRPFPPMRLKVRANLFDTDTGERIWTFHHTFDGDDATVMNGLRVWWNTRLAGGDPRNTFETTFVRPSVFTNFVFYMMARSYERARVMNVIAIENEKSIQAQIDEEIERLQNGEGPLFKHPAYE